MQGSFWRARAPHLPQSLNYRRTPRSLNGILPCHHVHSLGEAPTTARLDRTFHCGNPVGLGHLLREPRITSEAKALIQPDRAKTRAIATTPFEAQPTPPVLPAGKLKFSRVKSCDFSGLLLSRVQTWTQPPDR